MKKISIIALCITLTATLFAQSTISKVFPMKEGKIYYSEVITVDASLTADNLYSNAKSWASMAFRSAKDATQSDDKEAKTIIIKSYISKGHNAYLTNPRNWFVLKIEMKDGRYKYTLTDIQYDFSVSVSTATTKVYKPLEVWATPSGNLNEKKQKKVDDALIIYFEELDAEFKAIIADMTKSISTPVEQW